VILVPINKTNQGMNHVKVVCFVAVITGVKTMGDCIFRIVIGIVSIIVGCNYSEKMTLLGAFLLILGGMNLGLGFRDLLIGN